MDYSSGQAVKTVEGVNFSANVNKPKTDIEDAEVYVWAAVDVETFEVMSVEVSPGRSSLDEFLFLREVLKYCRSKPIVLDDCGLWYDWPLDLLECEEKREI